MRNLRARVNGQFFFEIETGIIWVPTPVKSSRRGSLARQMLNRNSHIIGKDPA